MKTLGLLAGFCFLLSGCDSPPQSHPTKIGAKENAAGSPDAPVTADGIPSSVVAANATLPDDWFEDVTDRTTIRFSYRNGREANRFFIAEIIGGGPAMVDYDLDGDIDLFFTGGGTISTEPETAIGGLTPALFRNDSDWCFVDATIASGFRATSGYTHGCTVTDFNCDGFPDLFVCCFGRSRLYSNLGDGTFAEAGDAAKLPALGWCTTAVFADCDRDGLPDLLLSRYSDWNPDSETPCTNREGVRDVCEPSVYPRTTCLLLHNSGDGSFEDWSEQAGFTGRVRGLGSVAADLNGDGWIDFYVASDESPKQLYLGGPRFPLMESAVLAGVAFSASGRSEGSMGIAVGDYDGDGLPDIFVTNFELEDYALYRNLGNDVFMHSTVAVGLSANSRMRSGWGAELVDFDGDGWLDIFVLNGSPFYNHGQSGFEQVPHLYRNLRGKRFEAVTDRGGTFFRQVHAGRGTAVGDLDGDGAPDIVTVQINEPVRILRNRLLPKNYVTVQLRALTGEAEATGARLTTTFDGRTLTRFVVQGAGYGSRSDPRFILPVNEAGSECDVTIAWPGRGHESFRRLAVRQTHLLIEGRGDQVDEPK
jgi:hypothetical protein